jgi:hypothetical protein
MTPKFMSRMVNKYARAYIWRDSTGQKDGFTKATSRQSFNFNRFSPQTSR